MAKIPIYDNKLFPDPQPLADAGRGGEKVAYYRANMARQGFNEFGNGVQEAYKALTADDKQAAMEEVSGLTGDTAEANANLAVEWQQAALGADPSKIRDVQQQFMENNFSKAYDGLGENLKSDKARTYFQKARARAYAHFQVTTNADAANVTARWGVDQGNKIYAQNSNLIQSDPTGWKSVIAQSDEAVDALSDVHDFNGLKANELKDKFNHDYAKTAAAQMVYDDPELGRQAIANGDFDKYLTGPEKHILEKQGVAREHEIDQNEKTKSAAILAQRKTEANEQLNELHESVPINDAGYYQVPADYVDKLDAIAKTYKDVITPSQLQSARNWAATETRRTLKSIAEVKVSDPPTYNMFAQKLGAGSLTNEEVLQARADNKLSQTDFKHFSSMINKPPSQRADMGQAYKFLDAKKNFIAHSAPSYEDTLGADRFQEYKSDMIEAYKEMKSQGKSVADWQKYAAEALPHYYFTPAEVNKLTSKGYENLSEPDAVTPPGATPAREPGESADDFLKRSGAAK